MPREFNRTQRVADLLQREIAKLIQVEMDDPRLRWVTVTAVTVSSDISFAKVYVTQHKEEKEIEQTVRLLNKAANHLRYRLAHLIKLRIIPELRFVYDESITHGAQLSSLIDQAVAEDERKHKKE